MENSIILQTKLEDLERHKDEYNNKIEDWTQKKDSQRKKLKMTRDMLQQLERERNKVKCPFLHISRVSYYFKELKVGHGAKKVIKCQ